MSEDDRRDFEAALNRRFRGKTVREVFVSENELIRFEFTDGTAMKIGEIMWTEMVPEPEERTGYDVHATWVKANEPQPG